MHISICIDPPRLLSKHVLACHTSIGKVWFCLLATSPKNSFLFDFCQMNGQEMVFFSFCFFSLTTNWTFFKAFIIIYISPAMNSLFVSFSIFFLWACFFLIDLKKILMCCHITPFPIFRFTGCLFTLVMVFFALQMLLIHRYKLAPSPLDSFEVSDLLEKVLPHCKILQVSLCIFSDILQLLKWKLISYKLAIIHFLKCAIEWHLRHSQYCITINSVWVPNTSLTPQETPYPLVVTPCCLPSQPLETTHLPSVPMDLPVLDISCKWNYTICETFGVWLLLLSTMFSRFIWLILDIIIPVLFMPE